MNMVQGNLQWSAVSSRDHNNVDVLYYYWVVLTFTVQTLTKHSGLQVVVVPCKQTNIPTIYKMDTCQQGRTGHKAWSGDPDRAPFDAAKTTWPKKKRLRRAFLWNGGTRSLNPPMCKGPPRWFLTGPYSPNPPLQPSYEMKETL